LSACSRIHLDPERRSRPAAAVAAGAARRRPQQVLLLPIPVAFMALQAACGFQED
jgi:hypothetical protein